MSRFKDNWKLLKTQRELAGPKYLTLIKENQKILLKVYRLRYVDHWTDIYVRKIGTLNGWIFFWELVFLAIFISPIALPRHMIKKRQFAKELEKYSTQGYQPKSEIDNNKLAKIINEFNLNIKNYNLPKAEELNEKALEENWFK